MQTHVHPAGWRTYNLWLCERPHRPSLWSTESVLINWNNVRRGSEWPWLWPECLIPLFGRDDPINKKLRVVKRGGSSNSRIKYAIRVCIRIWWPMMIMYTNWPHVNAVYCIWEWSAPYTRQETSLERPSVCAWIESSLTGWWLFCSLLFFFCTNRHARTLKGCYKVRAVVPEGKENRCHDLGIWSCPMWM